MPKYVNLMASLWKLISKEHTVVIMGFENWVSVKKQLYYLTNSYRPGLKQFDWFKAGL